MRRADEDGQVALFILGVCVVLLAFVVGVVDVTAVQIARVRVYDASDAAAAGAADVLAEPEAYLGGVRTEVPLSSVEVAAEVRRHLASAERPAHVRSWAVADGTGSPDGVTARVVLTAEVEIPLGSALLDAVTGPVRVTVVSSAQGRVRAEPAR